MLVNALSCVCGSLDEEDAEDITKGFTIEVVDSTIRLFVTDGFKTEFEYKVLDDIQSDQTKTEEFYGIRRCLKTSSTNKSQETMLAFILDGRPKVVLV